MHLLSKEYAALKSKSAMMDDKTGALIFLYGIV